MFKCLLILSATRFRHEYNIIYNMYLIIIQWPHKFDGHIFLYPLFGTLIRKLAQLLTGTLQALYCNNVKLICLRKILAGLGETYLGKTVNSQFVIVVFCFSLKDRKIFKPLVHMGGFQGHIKVSKNKCTSPSRWCLPLGRSGKEWDQWVRV